MWDFRIVTSRIKSSLLNIMFGFYTYNIIYELWQTLVVVVIVVVVTVEAAAASEAEVVVVVVMADMFTREINRSRKIKDLY